MSADLALQAGDTRSRDPRSMRRRAQRFVRRYGAPPQCVGHYQPGHSQCDGDGEDACLWRLGCRVYQELCRARGVDPEVEKQLVPLELLVPIVAERALVAPPAGGEPASPRVARAWSTFLEGFRGASPIAVFPDADYAWEGQVYEATWRSHRPGFFRCKLLRVKSWRRGGRGSLPLVRYWPTVVRRVRPSVELRCDLATLLEACPAAVDYAERWTVSGPGGRSSSPLGATAVRVYPERIAELGRLAGRLLGEGRMRGTWVRGARVHSKRE